MVYLNRPLLLIFWVSNKLIKQWPFFLLSRVFIDCCTNAFSNFIILSWAFRFSGQSLWFALTLNSFWKVQKKISVIILLRWMEVGGICALTHVYFNRICCNAIRKTKNFFSLGVKFHTERAKWCIGKISFEIQHLF